MRRFDTLRRLFYDAKRAEKYFESREFKAPGTHESFMFSIPHIAITMKAESALGGAADVTLVLPKLPEAGAAGLAPTTSTTMMLALGDALAIGLFERKGLSAEHFHPTGGRNHHSDDGAAQVLLELHRPFDVLDRSADFSKYKVLILPEDWERLQVGMDALLRDGAPHQAEYRIRRPNGELRWCASTAAASQDETGKVAVR